AHKFCFSGLLLLVSVCGCQVKPCPCHYSAFSRNSLNFSTHFSKNVFLGWRMVFRGSSFSSYSPDSSWPASTGCCPSVRSSPSLRAGCFFTISRLLSTRPTAVAYKGLVVSASLSPARCSLG